MKRKLFNRLLQRHAGFCAGIGHPVSTASHTLRKNTKRDVKHWTNVALDVDKVYVSKTSDSGDYVIKLINSKGEKASLWLSGHVVRDITPY